MSNMHRLLLPSPHCLPQPVRHFSNCHIACSSGLFQRATDDRRRFPSANVAYLLFRPPQNAYVRFSSLRPTFLRFPPLHATYLRFPSLRTTYLRFPFLRVTYLCFPPLRASNLRFPSLRVTYCVSRLYVPRTCVCIAALEGSDGGRQQHCTAPELQAMVQNVHTHTAAHHHPPPASLGVVVPAEGGSLPWVQNGGRLADGGRGAGASEERHDARVCRRASHNRPRAAAIQHRDGDGLERNSS